MRLVWILSFLLIIVALELRYSALNKPAVYRSRHENDRFIVYFVLSCFFGVYISFNDGCCKKIDFSDDLASTKDCFLEKTMLAIRICLEILHNIIGTTNNILILSRMLLPFNHGRAVAHHGCVHLFILLRSFQHAGPITFQFTNVHTEAAPI